MNRNIVLIIITFFALSAKLSDATTPNNINGDWATVAAGRYHKVAIKKDGTLWAWGDNHYGQLGDGSLITKNAPVQIGIDTDWEYVCAGSRHTAAIKTDGTLWEWGNAVAYSPIQIGTDADWRSVAAGNFYTVAIKKDGTLWAWGQNFQGQLGDGTTTDRDEPVQIGIGTNWKSVSAANFHTVAIKTDGTLWEWGIAGVTSPVQVGTEASWKSVSAGFYYAVAIKMDGTLWAWGSNFDGHLGTGFAFDTNIPVQIGSGNDWLSIAAGIDHTIALKSDGTLWAWGENDFCQLGDGTCTDKNVPVQIGNNSDWVSAATGDSFTLAAKKDGSLWAWGSNYINHSTETIVVTPERIGSDTDWVSIAADDDVSIALKANGTLWAWGDNRANGFGDGTSNSNDVPVQIGSDTNWASLASADKNALLAMKTNGALWGWGTGIGLSPIQIGSSTDWKAATSKEGSILAIKNGGTLWGWGNNQYGMLGDGSTIDKKALTQIGNESNWEIVSKGCTHSVAVKTDGTLWAWGRNKEGQLGDSTTTDSYIPVQIGPDTDWKSVAAGCDQTVALKANGTLWEWSIKASLHYSGISPVQTGNNTDWSSVTIGNYQRFAIKTDGTLWAWGFNYYGQLGDGTNSNKDLPVQIGNDANWKSVVPGGSHTVALKTDGTLWAWGDNSHGQLGDGSAFVKQPAKVNILLVKSTAEANGVITPAGTITGLSGSRKLYEITPNDNYHIGSVTGCNGILSRYGDTNRYLTGAITSDCAVDVTFDIDKFTITATASTGGSVFPSSFVSVNYGDNQKVIIAPDDGYHIVDVKIDGNSLGAIAEYIFTGVTSNHILDVTFAADSQTAKYKLTIKRSGKGKGNISSSDDLINCGGKANDCTETYYEGLSVFLKATPDNKSIFTAWTGCDQAEDDTCIVTMDKSAVVTANFSRQFTLKVNKNGDGSISCKAGDDDEEDCTDIVETAYAEGTKIILTQTPDENSIFKGWSGNCKGKNYTCSIIMNGNKTITANYESAGAKIYVSPATLNFGTTNKSKTRKLKIINKGNQVLAVTAITSDGDFYTNWNQQEIQIQPKKGVVLSVTFTPSTTGPQTGTLSIISNDANTPSMDVQLSGTGK